MPPIFAVFLCMLLFCVFALLRKKSVAPCGDIAIVMVGTPEIEGYAKYTREINRRYAERHGFSFYYHSTTMNPVHPVWQKIDVISKALPRHDAVFYIDSDAIFQKQEVSLRKWLRKGGDLLICDDLVASGGKNIANGGTLFVKNTPWSKQFLDRWWSKRNMERYNEFPREQQAFHDMHASNELLCKAHVTILPANELNSSWEQISKRDTGSLFIVHLMATGEAERIKFFSSFRLGS